MEARYRLQSVEIGREGVNAASQLGTGHIRCHAQPVSAGAGGRLEGEDGGQWHAAIGNQQLAVTPGVADNPTVTLSMAARDYLAMVNGELNAMQAFMQGKIRMKGDMALVMKMQKMFHWG
jgi:putative sterol carrier protein